MTLRETAMIMDILTAAYPQFYRGRGAADPEQALALWAGMFAEEPFELVAMAVKALIACDEKGFPPHIGAVKARVRQITQAPQIGEEEAWALVQRAIRNGVYGSRAEFEKLPPALQKLVGGPSQLRDWALMDAGQVQSVVASNVQRAYRARVGLEREMDALPIDVRKKMQAAAERLKLDSEEDEG